MLTPPEHRSGGFAIVSALFIIVALAALGAFIAVVSGGQQIGSAYDVNGARAYYAAVGCVDTTRGTLLWNKPSVGAEGVGGDAEEALLAEAEEELVRAAMD